MLLLQVENEPGGGVDRTLPQGVTGDDHEPSIEELLTDTTPATITIAGRSVLCAGDWRSASVTTITFALSDLSSGFGRR
jgi:hypothetical protein